MEFDKPKVTIDLEEYRYLKDRVASINEDEIMWAAKQIILYCARALKKHGESLLDVLTKLNKDGIYVRVTDTPGLVSADHIEIWLKNKEI